MPPAARSPRTSPSYFADPTTRSRAILLSVALLVVAIVALLETSSRGWIAVAIAVAYPIVVMALFSRRILTAPPRVRRAAMVLIAVVVVAGEGELAQAYYPFKPMAEATLSTKARDASVNLPNGPMTIEVQTRGELTPGSRSTEGDFVYTLTRGEQKVTVRGELTRRVGRTPRMLRRGASNKYVTTHEAERTEVALAGSGPIHLHLTEESGSLRDKLVITFLPAPISSTAAWSVALALVAGAVVVQTIAARRGVDSRFAVGVCIACAFPLYFDHFFDPGDPFVTLISSSFVAILGGTIAGFLLTRLARRWATPAPPWRTPPPKKA